MLKIEKINSAEVYDITVQDNHNFYANDILVHNCTEIFQATDYDRTILCNLGSLNLSKVNSREDLERVIPIAMRMLDNTIDVSSYPIQGTEKVQKQTRAVGLGVAGEAEMIANMQIMYGSEEHQKLIDELYGNIAEISDQASRDLAKERGAWEEGKEFRNAYRRAIAPTSSISVIMGTSACHEPVFDKVWIEENKLGNIKVTAPNISPDNFQYYPNAYEVDQMDSVRCQAIRTKHLDQGGSFNVYYRPGVSGKTVFDTFMLAHELGLKSTYYLRSESVKESNVKNDVVACFGCSG